MFRGTKVLGLVPARAGSRRLPGKNIQAVAGRPLISWTLDAAIGAANIDRTVVSTDDINSIANAVGKGFSDYLMRPAHFASHSATMTSVVFHAIETLKEQGDEFGYLVLLQPTSPLRTAEHIDKAFAMMEEKKAAGVVSICLAEHPKEWMGRIDDNGLLDTFFDETKLDLQSQVFAPTYQVNGAIYIVPVKEFLHQETLFLASGMAGVIMERRDSIDVDHLYDLKIADWLLRQRDAIRD